MRICCCFGSGATAPEDKDRLQEGLLESGSSEAVGVRSESVDRGAESMQDIQSIHSSMHSGKSSTLDPLDDSNLHEALHWDKILQKPDEGMEPSLLGSQG